MGEVYRARDTRLDRTVAIKILQGHLTLHPEVRQRFEREARVISGLSRPNICTLFDVGHQDGTDYLVMEYGVRRRGIAGGAARARSDIFSFGAVLYEMATGSAVGRKWRSSPWPDWANAPDSRGVSHRCEGGRPLASLEP